eukprot:scaffold5381_cov76-Skeletonema_dohrnii-CCMP3373.AAC.2
MAAKGAQQEDLLQEVHIDTTALQYNTTHRRCSIATTPQRSILLLLLSSHYLKFAAEAQQHQ